MSLSLLEREVGKEIPGRKQSMNKGKEVQRNIPVLRFSKANIWSMMKEKRRRGTHGF
jgi:hypothetical protein